MNEAVLQRHPTLWYPDGNIVLQAGQILFNVHRAFLAQESGFFEDMFALPQPAESRDGTEEQPLLLLDVTSDTLANILKMMYTICGLELTFDVEQLVGILCVSHKLQFHNVENVVRGKVESLIGPQRRLRLALDGNGVDQWALPAFWALVCTFDAHAEVATPSLLDHALWSTVYATRLRIMQSRMEKAVEIATRDLDSSNKLCKKHHKAVYTAINSGRYPAEVITRLDVVNAERRSPHGMSTCTHADGFQQSASYASGPFGSGPFGQEWGWAKAAWDAYQARGNVYSP